jgi:colicin import membrane protein
VSTLAASTPTPIVWRPALVTVVLHALLLYVLTANWMPSQETFVVPKKTPRYIDAKLVDAAQLKPKKKKPVAKKTVATKPAAKPKPKPRTAAKPKPAAAKPKPKPTPVPKVEEQARPSAEERAADAQRELALAMESEDVLLEEASDLELAQSYVALIARTVEDNWSRPPSARNGMEAELVLQLIPTGEVVNVSLSRSSGNGAFDRSAINAVQKAERFPELQNVPSRIFEQNFRRLRLKFKPEDLRY